MRAARVTLVAVLALTACSAGPAPTPPAEAVSCASGAITGQGSSAQTTAVNTWIRDYQVACGQATVAYNSVGSGAGVRAFAAGTGDFAGSDSVVSGADASAVAARCTTGRPVHLPMVVGPIALAYTVAGAGDLRLSPATVAKIFAGTVTAWNDPAIKADNPDSVLPSTRIRPIHREDSSGTTDNFTKFLSATAGSDWKYGSGSEWTAPGGIAAKGSNRVSAAIARTDGAIGYIEWSYAEFHHLATARIGNGAGEFAELTAPAAAATVAAARTTGTDLKLTIDYGTTAAGAYPIVLVTYEIVCPQSGRPLIKSFLAYAVSEAGQAAAARLGYAALPGDLRDRVAAAVAALK